MKQLLISFIVLLSMSVSAQNIEQNRESFESLSQEQREKVLHFAELHIWNVVDSIIQEGMFMHALEILDSLQTNWTKTSGMKPTPLMYMIKGQIYMHLEEWQELIEITTECISNNKETMTDGTAAIIYKMRGSSYRNLEDYKNAIRSYEYAASFYSKQGDYGGQGDILCTIAYCYEMLGIKTIASSFYEKGLNKFLQYFHTTKQQLLRRYLKVEDDSLKESALDIFSLHLFKMAIFEEDNGNRLASKDYLLMSAHCGYSEAKSEYQRIYGRIK